MGMCRQGDPRKEGDHCRLPPGRGWTTGRVGLGKKHQENQRGKRAGPHGCRGKRHILFDWMLQKGGDSRVRARPRLTLRRAKAPSRSGRSAGDVRSTGILPQLWDGVHPRHHEREAEPDPAGREDLTPRTRGIGGDVPCSSGTARLRPVDRA